MITGHATKIINFGAIKIVLGIKHFIIYLVYVILFALFSGLLIELVGGNCIKNKIKNMEA